MDFRFTKACLIKVNRTQEHVVARQLRGLIKRKESVQLSVSKQDMDHDCVRVGELVSFRNFLTSRFYKKGILGKTRMSTPPLILLLCIN